VRPACTASARLALEALFLIPRMRVMCKCAELQCIVTQHMQQVLLASKLLRS
jgi:hypothetical protein